MKGQQYDPNDWEHYWEKPIPGGMTFQQIQGRFQWGACTEGMMWAMTQPDAQTAWLACKNGRWMRWALNAHIPMLETEEKDKVLRQWVWNHTYDNNGNAVWTTPEWEEEYANEIRRWYPVWPGN